MAIENVVMDWGTWLYGETPHGADNFMNIRDGTNVLMHFPALITHNVIVRVIFRYKVTVLDGTQVIANAWQCTRQANANATLYSSGITDWSALGAMGEPGDHPSESLLAGTTEDMSISLGWNSFTITRLNQFYDMMNGYRQMLVRASNAPWAQITKAELPYFEVEYRSTPIGGIQIF